MQVIGIPNNSPNAELVIAHTSHKEKYFGCKYSDKEKKIIKIGDKELISKNRISEYNSCCISVLDWVFFSELFEHRSFFKSGQFLCAITIEFRDDLTEFKILRSISGTNTTDYTADRVNYFTNDLSEFIIWNICILARSFSSKCPPNKVKRKFIAEKIKCDAYAIKSRKVSDHQIQDVRYHPFEKEWIFLEVSP